jgi:hypothetical protein
LRKSKRKREIYLLIFLVLVLLFFSFYCVCFNKLFHCPLFFLGIWKNGLPIAKLEEFLFEDAIPDHNDKIYSKSLKRMVPRKAIGGRKTAVIIKRVM